jgi:hypothetical protein
MDQTSQVLRSAAALRAGLEDAAGALATGNLERLLQSEARLELALNEMSQCSPASLAATTSEATRTQLSAEIAHSRAALARCRRHGEALNDFVRMCLTALGEPEGYGPRGSGAPPQRHSIHRTA